MTSNLDSKEVNTQLSPETVRKTDFDIQTIKLLSTYAKQTGNHLVITGGYAVEALTGGRITRPHGDIDAHFVVVEGTSPDEIFSKVDQIVMNETHTNWKLRKQKPKKAEFLEEKESEFKDKRRLEFSIHAPDEYPPEIIQKAQLIDSQGNCVEIEVIEITEMVAHKIHKFWELKGGIDTEKDRHPNPEDYSDLKRLMTLPSFDKEKTLERISKRFYKYKEDNPESSERAKQEFEYAVSLLNSEK